VGWDRPELVDPSDMILMKEDPETYEAKRRGLDQKYQAL
jgi:hypothetical protein